MTSKTLPFYRSLESLGEVLGDPLPVTLSPELVGLLSEQLYRSPSKAIEELVVNGFDADASESRVFVPTLGSDTPIIVVYDDGSGMTYEGLADLWKIGRAKQRSGSLGRHKERKQIGKFGIGKLATYTIADSVTYVTKTSDEHLGVTIDYRKFTSDQSATPTQIGLTVHRTGSIDPLWTEERFRLAVESIGLDLNHLTEQASWTIVILEDLKEKARAMQPGRLKWVLRTAMPLSTQFNLFLNKERVESSKEDYEKIVDFDICDLPKERLQALSKATQEEWTVVDGKLVAESFREGIVGRAMAIRPPQTLTGKSEEMGRSNGFFVYIRERLINEESALFGLHALLHQVWNRFRADIYMDDLDKILTANREDIRDEKLYRNAQHLLLEVFNEARRRYEHEVDNQRKVSTIEDKYNWVHERLVEHPTADSLLRYSQGLEGGEPDDSWMYLKVDPHTNVKDLANSLYASVGQSRPYRYQTYRLGKTARIVSFDPSSSTFTINEDHELVHAYADQPGAQGLLKDVITSEALLEVYLREAGVEAHVIGDVIERRDSLLRSLANSHMYSLPALSEYILDSATNATHLEMAVVAGARALGFVAKHKGGSGEPDGVARFIDYPRGEQKIILEAKSSIGTPNAKDIDFAAISNHMERENASGCLLIAPNYPGGDTGNVAMSAQSRKISCWTVGQYADVIRSAESRHITARQILDIVHGAFTPNDVDESVRKLLSEPSWERRELYRAIIRALREGKDRLVSSPRLIAVIASDVARMEGFQSIAEADVRQAVLELAGASMGALLVRHDAIVELNVDYDELDRRVQMLTRMEGRPRRMGSFGEVTASSEEQQTE